MANRLRGLINAGLETFGLSILRNQLGASILWSDPFVEQKRIVNKEDVTIFDVGAHVGDISKIYNSLFSKAVIYAFEPFKDSFVRLQTNMLPHPNVHVLDCGLADRSGLLPFYDNTSAATNSLLEADNAADATWGRDVVKSKGVVRCKFTTLDEFVSEHGIEFIDILKLDAQGAETTIMDGARETLASHSIGLVYTEIITMPTYKGQKAFWEILKQFDAVGMSLYNMYNFDLVDGRLRQVDAIFVASKTGYAISTRGV